MTDPDRLIDEYLDGKLSKEAMDQLERDLVSNPAYADHFAKAMMVDALLKDRYERESIASSMQLTDGSFIGEDDLSLLIDDYNHAEAELVHVGGKAKRVTRKPFNTQEIIAWGPALRYAFGHGSSRLIRSKAGVVGALAAVLLLSLWLVNPFGDSVPEGDSLIIDTPDPVTREPTAEVVAMLTSERGAVWAVQGGDTAPTTGDTLTLGHELTLTLGSAEITTKRGAVAILEAPATIELTDSDNAIHLHAGKLVGLCHTESSKGFVVRTEHGTIVDLGTEFAVRARADGVDTTVFVGEVTLTTPDGATQPITTNQTARLTIEDGQRMIAFEDKAIDGFTRRLPRPALVTNASINLDGFKVEVVPNGVYEDVRLYSDCEHELNGFDDNGLPSLLIGGDLIRMPASARPDVKPAVGDRLRLEVEVAMPADIYLLLPEDSSIGDWLQHDYTKTGLFAGGDLSGATADANARYEGGTGPGVSIDRKLAIWKRKQPATGRATVAESISRTMYSVVVVPRRNSNELN